MKPVSRAASSADSGDSTPVRSPLDWPAEAGLGRELAREIRSEVRRRRRKRLGVATAMCALLGSVLLWQRESARSPANPLALVSARVSAPERRALPDGSVVELKNGAAIDVDFTDDVRRVVLTRGEAHFEVAKTNARPFVVAVDGIEVRAVGTAFAVERGGSAIEVVVTEGRVTVAREPVARAGRVSPKAPPADPTLVAAGNRATLVVNREVPPEPVVTALSATDIAQRLAWRVPRLEFSGAPLSEVVSLFAAHGHIRFVIGDAELREVRVSGILRADNSDALLQLLAADHGIEAEHRAGDIVLRRRR